ncbi:MAG: mannose-1-phosphate guanylyltransferase/mannose-6-phosphate isomerase [Gammaproteobacteria bacterium]|nr:mannose-1-phosphate guanylyltransferase/mannose-6-phosphate isomerase [Gammaproteobacteria bacterium]MDH3465607.1 mannose-1-phosphate guanylyltransferase/mannose-6-phosphate isomerase [Gammaproteobacteria bacterium]
MSDTFIPVVLCGGSGTRLWPLSRRLQPKQFHALVDEDSLLQSTVKRLKGIGRLSSDPAVVCNEEHRFLVAEQLRAIDYLNVPIYLEPEGRNTAPAVALVALSCINHNDDPILLALPADHIINDVPMFHRRIETALPYARDGDLVTFGITPTRPETGYGYIRKDASAARSNDEIQVYGVREFVEKPDLTTAERYITDGEYLWNSGMFMFRASVLVAELHRQRPDIIRHIERALTHRATDHDFVRPSSTDFLNCPSESIDYAVMEGAQNRIVVELDAGWSDVGSWNGMWEAKQRDPHGNVVHGDVVLADVSNSYIRADHRLVAAVGITNTVVVDTVDCVLVGDKGKIQDVKKIVAALERSGREEINTHKKVPRPWGSYQGLDQGDNYQVKKLVLNPGAQISLQLHHKRSEHWVIVSGTARVTCGDQITLLSANESTYIPVETRHQLENVGTTPLQVIEVQTGTYFGEDDIVRFEDKYGRV